ncbi:MAG: hypothetical protein MHM6MM_008724 [Cercozoa sp. M6MM]
MTPLLRVGVSPPTATECRFRADSACCRMHRYRAFLLALALALPSSQSKVRQVGAALCEAKTAVVRDFRQRVLCLRKGRVTNHPACVTGDQSSRLRFVRADGQNTVRFFAGSMRLCARCDGAIAECGSSDGDQKESDTFRFHVLPSGFVALTAFDRYCQINVDKAGSAMRCVGERVRQWEAFEVSLSRVADVTDNNTDTECLQHVVRQSMRQPLPHEGEDYLYYCGDDNKNKGMTRTVDLFGYSIHFGLVDRRSNRWQTVCRDVRPDRRLDEAGVHNALNDNTCFPRLGSNHGKYLKRYRMPYIPLKLFLAQELENNVVTRLPPTSSSLSVMMLHLRHHSRLEPSFNSACSCNVRGTEFLRRKRIAVTAPEKQVSSSSVSLRKPD